MGNRIDRRFDFLKQQAEQQANEQNEQANKGLQRQAAASGRLGSGSYQKQQLELNKAASQNTQRQVGDVEAQREGALAQQEEQQAQRDFASQEAEKGRVFGREERISGQEYQSGEAEKQRGFSQGMFDKEMEFKNKTADIQNAQFNRQIKFELGKFNHEKAVDAFNEHMATQMWDKKDMAEGIANAHGYNPRTGKMDWTRGIGTGGVNHYGNEESSYRSPF